MEEKHDGNPTEQEAAASEAGSETGDAIRTGIDPKALIGGVALLAVVGLLGWSFYSGQAGGAATAPPTSAGTKAGAASPAGQPAPTLAGVERLMLAGKLPEARDMALELDLAAEENVQAYESIKALFLAEEHLQSGNAAQATRALSRVAEQYRSVPMALELETKIERALGNSLRSKLMEAEAHFAAERYDSAKRVFAEIVELDPNNKRAAMMAEAAGLAEPLLRSIRECDELLKQVEYGKVEAAAAAGLAKAKAARHVGAADELATLVTRLNDYHCHAKMLRVYDVEGDAEEAARLRDAMSDLYADALGLRTSAQLREVGELAARAEAERSFELAQLVLAKEQNTQNAIHKRIAALSRQIRADREATRMSRLDKARELDAAGDLEAAFLEAYGVLKDNTQDIDVQKFHAELAGRIFAQAHSLAAEGPSSFPERLRLVTLVAEHSVVDTTVRAQADNALRRLEIEQTRAFEEARGDK